MKRFSFLSLALLGATSLFGAKKAPEITNIEPPYWWVGMANDTLQVMVTGPGIANAEVSLDYKGVHLDKAVSLDSPNYKFLYLTIDSCATPGKLPLEFTLNGRKSTVHYELKARDMAPENYAGFSAADVLYLLMPDRFSRGEGAASSTASLQHPTTPDRTRPSSRHGGNLKGIINHLDYLDSLGVTALWVCPVLENDMPGGSYHGYATTNYYRIDPRFGSNEEWQQLVTEARKKGIKVVMDMIFNHSGSNHPWMADAPSADWYNHPDGKNLTNFRLSTLHDPYVSDYDLDHTVNG
ncbi:MAG: cyclomaltodextrinase N-terminal domain-containing protein, partial [Muribaculaceae bacterium]|nr:cyclomaltodextrinase N-terminal domain-containing protein [Muribaculaceae bacterium]